MTSSAPLAVLGCGLVSGVGLTAAESCAAIRGELNNFQETRFLHNGEWLVGSVVALEEPRRGVDKLAKMASLALEECFAGCAGDEREEIPVLVCLSETDRPGRFAGLSTEFLQNIESEVALHLHPLSRVIEYGRVGGAVALLQARQLLTDTRCKSVIVAGVDSYFTVDTLSAYGDQDRLLSETNSNGFIPGEAAAAVLLRRSIDAKEAPLLLRGLGFGMEPAPLNSDKPLRANGLCEAIRGALEDASVALKECDCRISDANGEHYRFKEAALAVTRLLRDRKAMFSLWHPADCIGEVGAATLPAMLTILLYGALKNYLPGPVFLGHLSNDDEKRAAFVSEAQPCEHLGEALRRKACQQTS